MKTTSRILSVMVCAWVVAAFFSAAVPVQVSASGIVGMEEWVARYNGPPGNGSDQAYAIATDASGNVYVTGYSQGVEMHNYDYATVAYDSSGNKLWDARYYGPTNSADRAHAIATDASGKVYVTGESVGDGTGFDYATVAYDSSSGKELWVARYNGPANLNDKAGAITTDASGNVYVTGTSNEGGTNDAYATVAYDSSGNELWVARYNGPGNAGDVATAIVTDASGKVYVTGRSYGSWGPSGSGLDYATIAYDSSGNELWVARYNGGGNSEDLAYAIATDTFGKVYVTGYSGSSGSYDKDYATVAYDSSGNELWVARYNGPGSGEDWARAIATDAYGNVYVTGWSWGGDETGFDYATVAYDSSGNELWVARYNCPENSSDLAEAIANDSSGNVYVTGRSDGIGPGSNYATVAYDSSGNELWVARYNGPANSEDKARAIATDAYGNVYVTGSSSGYLTGYDYATIKYSGPSLSPPVANAGLDQAVFDEATLDGSQSYDEDGTIEYYDWMLQHRETGYVRTAEGVNPIIPNLMPGFYDVTLIVTDDDGATDTDTMLLAVSGESSTGCLYTQEDLDQAVADAEATKDLIIAQKDQLIYDLQDTNASMFTQEELNQAVAEAEAAKDVIIALLNQNTAILNATIESQTKTIDSLISTLFGVKADAIAANAAQNEAQKALDQAIAEGGKAKEIKKAEKEMQKAQKELDHIKKDGTPDPKYDKAINHYKKAWKHAQKAMK